MPLIEEKNTCNFARLRAQPGGCAYKHHVNRGLYKVV